MSLEPLQQRKLVIWGASGHALVVADIIRAIGEYEIVAFFEDIAGSQVQTTAGVPVLRGIDNMRLLRNRDSKHLIVAFGHCSARLRAAQQAREEGFDLATAIHPRAAVAADVRVGEGSVIVAGGVINPNSIVGENVIVNTCASVDHECVLEDGVHVGPGASLGGRVEVGRAAWIGIGAVVRDRIRIGANAIVGAGSVVLDDVPENTVVFGTPAKVVRKVGTNEN